MKPTTSSIGRWVVVAVHGGDEPARIEPLEAIELDVARWWLESD